ncbi:MAG: VOC family protein, partial [Haloarculaceae archaeon]
MDIHHVGQLLDADFEPSVAFYRETLGLSLRETTDGPVRVAFFETGSVEFHLIVRESRGSPADAAGLGFIGDPVIQEGLGPYRRAFVAPEEHVGV